MNSIIVGFGRVIYSIVIFLLTVYCSRFFSIDFYINFREFILYFLMGINISAIPATNSIYFFRNRGYRNLSYIYFISFVFQSISFLILFIFSRSFVIPFSFIVSTGSIFFLVSESISLSRRNPFISFILNIFESLSYFIPIIMIKIFKMDEYYFFYYLIFLSFIKIIFYYIVAAILNTGKKNYHFKEMVKFTTPLYLNGILGSISKQIDKFIVSLFYYGKSFADYSTGTFEIPFIARFFSGVFHERADRIKEMIEKDEKISLMENFSRLLNYSFMVLGILTILFFINAKDVMSFLFSKTYENSYKYFMVYLTVLPLRNIPFGFLLSLKGNTFKLFFISSFDSFLTLLLSLFFAKSFNIFFVSFSFVIATVVSVFITIYFIRDIFPSGKFVKRYILVLTFLAISLIFLNKLDHILLTFILLVAYILSDMIFFWR